jgi:hypothetical protein
MMIAKVVAASSLVLGLITAAPLAHAQDSSPDDVLRWMPSPAVRDTRPAPEEDPTWAEPPDGPAAGFGLRGELLVSGRTGVGIAWTSWDSTAASSLRGGLGAELDYFVVANVSLGLSVDVSASDSKGYSADGSLVETKATLLSAGPILGVNARLGADFSFYPRVTFGVHQSTQSESLVSGTSLSIAASPTGSPDVTRFGPWVEAFTPVLFHAAPHLYFGFGPRLYHDFARAQNGPDVGAERTTIAAQLELGGYFGGGEPTREPHAIIRRAPAPRFGESGQLVLTNEFDLSAARSSYSGSDASATSVRVAPGVDYFVSEHVTFGGAVAVSYSAATGLQLTGPNVDTSATSVGFSMRAGFDLPLGGRLSVFSRASLGFDITSYDEAAGTSHNSHSGTATWVGLQVPLLLHVTDHWFFGVGPAITQDVDRRVGVSGQNRATHLAATTVLGGWL